LITGVRFYKGNGNTGTHIGHLWKSDGTLLASVTFTGETGSGWQQANFSAPVAVTKGTTYIVSYYAPNGHYSVDPNYFTYGGVDTGVIRASSNAEAGGNGLYSYGSDALPTNSYNATNYGVDVVFTSLTSNQPPHVVSESPMVGGTGISASAVISATFNESVVGSSVQMTVVDNNGISVAGSVTYNDSNHTATFTPNAKLAAGVTFTATVSGAKDATGNAMSSPFSWTFTTQALITNASIWSTGATPTVASFNDPNAVELGLQFKADVDGVITGVRFYKGTSNTGTHVAHLWATDGTLLATVTFTNETASGWQQANFSSPVTVKAGATYIVSYYAPNGGYAATGGYFANGPIDTGTITALNGVYSYGSDGFPNQSYNNTNYWVDVAFSAT
jgi:hypothetical protein